ncbi:hypothetical protein QFZ80_003055 [Paenibacillus sp. V4I7]|nr:hypothetical protein [Paenibacillus sp. V4I7]MDQ0914783.1 hypothetical protein [Paenibacillus sp. V4I5]
MDVLEMKCKVLNGYAQIGDIITVVSYWDQEPFLYKVIGFQN